MHAMQYHVLDVPPPRVLRTVTLTCCSKDLLVFWRAWLVFLRKVLLGSVLWCQASWCT